MTWRMPLLSTWLISLKKTSLAAEYAVVTCRMHEGGVSGGGFTQHDMLSALPFVTCCVVTADAAG